MKLRFIHFSDSHLGASDSFTDDYTVKDVREKDKYIALKETVDHILDLKPDFVLHTGDFFHRSSPGNAALVNAINQIGRLSDAGIPFYMIAGNHDYPKVISTEPIHKIFEHLKHVKIFYDESYSSIELEHCTLHAIPHINTAEKLKTEVEKIRPNGNSKPNILMMHLSMPIRQEEEIELGGGVFPPENLAILGQFDYVALGHWHKFRHMREFGNVYYSGAPDKMDLGEINHEKGFVSVEIDGKGPVVEFIPLKTREILKVTVDDCDKKNEVSILGEISEALKDRNTMGSIIYIFLNDLSKVNYYDTRREEIENLTIGCLDLRISKKLRGNSEDENGDAPKPYENLFEDLRKAFTDDNDYLRFQELTDKLLADIENERAQNVD
jgi:exonuclease SbcD